MRLFVLLGLMVAPSSGLAQTYRFTDADVPAARQLSDAVAEGARIARQARDRATATAGYWASQADRWEQQRMDPLTWLRQTRPSLRISPDVTYDPVCSRDRSLGGIRLGMAPQAIFTFGRGTAVSEAYRAGDTATINASARRISSMATALQEMKAVLVPPKEQLAALERVTTFFATQPGFEPAETKGTPLLARSARSSGDSLVVVVTDRASFFSPMLSNCEETLPTGLILIVSVRTREADADAPLRRVSDALRRQGRDPDDLLSTLYDACRDAQPDGYAQVQTMLRSADGAEQRELRARLANADWFRRHTADLGPRMRAISAADDGDDPCG